MEKEFFIYQGKVKLKNGPGCYKITEDPLWLLSLLPLDKNSYLDVGCGTGIIALLLKLKLQNKNAEISAIDIQKCMVKQAKEHAVINNISGIDFKTKNLYLMKQTNYFDCVFSNPPFFKKDCCLNKVDSVKNIAYIQEDISKYITKCLELVAPGGVLCFIAHISTRSDVLKCFKNVCDLIEICLISSPEKVAKRYVYIIKKNANINFNSINVECFDNNIRDNVLHNCEKLDIISNQK